MLKKKYQYSLLLVAILCGTIKIYATNTSVQISGQDEVKQGEIQTITLNLSSEENVVTQPEKKDDKVTQPGKKDNTVSKTTLPATGKSILVKIVIVLVFAIVIFAYKKVKEYKEIN